MVDDVLSVTGEERHYDQRHAQNKLHDVPAFSHAHFSSGATTTNREGIVCFTFGRQGISSRTKTDCPYCRRGVTLLERAEVVPGELPTLSRRPTAFPGYRTCGSPGVNATKTSFSFIKNIGKKSPSSQELCPHPNTQSQLHTSLRGARPAPEAGRRRIVFRSNLPVLFIENLLSRRPPRQRKEATHFLNKQVGIPIPTAFWPLCRVWKPDLVRLEAGAI